MSHINRESQQAILTVSLTCRNGCIMNWDLMLNFIAK